MHRGIVRGSERKLIDAGLSSDGLNRDGESCDDLVFGPMKRIKRSKNDDEDDGEQSLRSLILSINYSIQTKLNSIERKLHEVSNRLEKFEQNFIPNAFRYQSPSPEESNRTKLETKLMASPGVKSNICGPMNSEDDFPDGSWLGDETNSAMRVRCHIGITDLLHINTNCRTPEKMALTLLDYLFDRDTLAISNISGIGKHNKKQLNPVYIHGIRCHLTHHFNTSQEDWHKIKMSIDSKCRTAWRRKVLGKNSSARNYKTKGSSVPSSAVELSVGSTPSDLLVDGTSVTIEEAECNDLDSAFELVPNSNSIQIIRVGAGLLHLQNNRHVHIMPVEGDDADKQLTISVGHDDDEDVDDDDDDDDNDSNHHSDLGQVTS